MPGDLPPQAPGSAPPRLLALWPLVLRYGGSDDLARGRSLEAASTEELRELVASVDAEAFDAINRYLDETGDSEESVPFGDLAQAAMEASQLLERRGQ
jgi:hypothetical protein